MLIIEIQPLKNGAHRNQSGDLQAVPEGWIAVPAGMEAEARSYLPFIVLDIQDGVLAGVSQGGIPEPEPELSLPASLESRVASLESDMESLLTGLEAVL